jgi:hypothetical protein
LLGFFPLQTMQRGKFNGLVWVYGHILVYRVVFNREAAKIMWQPAND